MPIGIENWKIQVRKGYLELCILSLIKENGKLYGFDLLERLKEHDLHLKEGTLYPLLNRMTKEKVLQANWQTENVKGHPRKFYSLTRDGKKLVDSMTLEFDKMINTLKEIQSDNGSKVRSLPRVSR